VDFILTGNTVMAALEHIVQRSGYPRMITVDNGSEFPSKALDTWAEQHEVPLDFTRPGTPAEDAVSDSFNGRLRDECLNVPVFVYPHKAQQKIDAWRIDDNEHRPHGSLGNLTPESLPDKRPKPGCRTSAISISQRSSFSGGLTTGHNNQLR
jgi:putative transposase